MKDQTKTVIEGTVRRAQIVFGELLKDIDQYAYDISNEESAKIFNFLKNAIMGVEEKANELRRTARLTQGTFSFDMEIEPPEPSKPKVQSVPSTVRRELDVPEIPPRVARRIQAREERERLGGRLSVNSPDINPDLETAPITPSGVFAPRPEDLNHRDGGEGFLEE
jgi:hypothetical protein